VLLIHGSTQNYSGGDSVLWLMKVSIQLENILAKMCAYDICPWLGDYCWVRSRQRGSLSLNDSSLQKTVVGYTRYRHLVSSHGDVLLQILLGGQRGRCNQNDRGNSKSAQKLWASKLCEALWNAWSSTQGFVKRPINSRYLTVKPLSHRVQIRMSTLPG